MCPAIVSIIMFVIFDWVNIWESCPFLTHHISYQQRILCQSIIVTEKSGSVLHCLGEHVIDKFAKTAAVKR